ncbi:PAS domain-containing sensor histidine kinase [Halohasta litorea]|uniref:histidine kinase n=1 Tax=Halohasta litorea TaxID=869891 RepID=A0ABD6DFL6_9EURY|nr:PAS domain-containing sensor histidine kinase [Halohasta litorea]
MTASDKIVSKKMKLRSFRDAVKNTGHSIYWTDTTGTIEYVNPAFEDQTGYSAEEAVGSNANILQSGVHDDRFYERLWNTILAGNVWEGEITNKRKSGERYVAKQTISPITDDTGDIIRFVAINEGITDLRESQERLKQQRDRLAGLLDAIPVPLVLIEFDKGEPIVKLPNQQFKQTFGFTGQELGGSSLDKLIVESVESGQAHEVNNRLQQGEQVCQEVKRRTGDGEQRTFLLNGAPLTDGSDEILATYIDITDRKQMENELRQKTDELEDFANVVSHDLRNPLSVAIGHLDTLANEYDDSCIETIRSAHMRMQELIENILMLAKQGQRIEELESVSLSNCMKESWVTAETENATLQIESSRTIHADGNRLHQLFGNLIRNAIEHGGNDVTVTVGDLDNGFYIEDDGPGIPEEERTEIFKAGHTTTEVGTGFGLSIVKEIVDAHGWCINVTDGYVGGARFEITDVEIAE